MGNDWREFCLVPSAKGGVDVKVFRGGVGGTLPFMGTGEFNAGRNPAMD